MDFKNFMVVVVKGKQRLRASDTVEYCHAMPRVWHRLDEYVLKPAATKMQLS